MTLDQRKIKSSLRFSNGDRLKWHNIPRFPFRPSFGRGPVSTLSSGLQFLAKLCPWLGKSTRLEQNTTGSVLLEICIVKSLKRILLHPGFIPKQGLSDPKDSASVVDAFVNMIAPWEIVRYCNTEILIFFTLSRLSPFGSRVHNSFSTYLVCELYSLFQIYRVQRQLLGLHHSVSFL